MKEIDPTEFDLIQFIRDQDRVEDKAIVRSIGDDCAVWRSHPSVQYLVSTDLLVEEVHFRRQWISPRFLGRKAFLVNLSDLAAMGARPFCCLLSLSLPACLTGSFFEEVIAGFRRECKQNKTTLVGGDLSSGREIQISVTIIGTVESGSPVYRSAAKPGDHIFLIGNPGRAQAGLEYLQGCSPVGLDSVSSREELRHWAGKGPELEWLTAHLVPEIPLEPAAWLRENHLVNAMIDSSDGLGNDLCHILKESGLTGEILLDQLPKIAGIRDRRRWKRLVLDGGEDYCLLGTCDSEQARRIHERYPASFPEPRWIGRLQPGKPRLLVVDRGQKELYRRKGFDHFT